MQLEQGNLIQIIAPSLFVDINLEKVQRAKNRLEKAGFRVSFCEGLLQGKPNKLTNSLSLEQRLKDFHEAYQDSDVRCIVAITGGYNANQLLPYIDFDIVKQNPKIFCGYSDITILCNAIYTKTQQETYLGANFNNFGVYDDYFFQFIFQHFLNVVNKVDSSFEMATKWADNQDSIYTYQEHLFFNKGIQVIREGNCEGKLVGGNLCTFNLLQGTPFMPDLTDSIVCIEDDQIFDDTQTFLLEFERNLVSLTQQPNFKKVRGLFVGRFEQVSGITIGMLTDILKSLPCLDNLPIYANFDFGHTSPCITIPIGRQISINQFNSSKK